VGNYVEPTHRITLKLPSMVSLLDGKFQVKVTASSFQEDVQGITLIAFKIKNSTVFEKNYNMTNEIIFDVDLKNELGVKSFQDSQVINVHVSFTEKLTRNVIVTTGTTEIVQPYVLEVVGNETFEANEFYLLKVDVNYFDLREKVSKNPKFKEV
jgi:Macroglobulin domain MG3